MPLRSTYEIELLISDIVERQWLWNIITPEYKDRVKKLDAWKKALEVLDKDQMKISFCSLLGNK